VQAQASSGGAGAGIYVLFSLAYRNVYAAPPGSFRIGIDCYPESFRYGNIIVGSNSSYSGLCGTNTSSGLKANTPGRGD